MGKLIVFWSPWHGQAKVTASMGAIAVQLNRISKERVIMTHSQFGMADLEGMFNRTEQEKRKLLYSNSGLSAAILRFKQNKLTEEAVEQCLLPITSTGLYLLPGTEQSASVVQETDTKDIVFTLLARDVPKYYEWTLVDVSSGNNPLSMKLIEAADVVVVTLSQNAATWDGFFSNMPSIYKKENVFYAFGGYNPDSRYSRKNFVRMYSNYVSADRVGVIPHCVGYMDAISSGTVAKFLYGNEYVKKDEENHYFIQECQRTAEKIKAYAEGR